MEPSKYALKIFYHKVIGVYSGAPFPWFVFDIAVVPHPMHTPRPVTVIDKNYEKPSHIIRIKKAFFILNY
jgi:hypothetical protein